MQFWRLFEALDQLSCTETQEDGRGAAQQIIILCHYLDKLDAGGRVVCLRRFRQMMPQSFSF
jgi:hypothetical protein